jgi:hypothetical protein
MGKKGLFILFGLILISCNFISSTTPINVCTDLNTPSEMYILTQNITGATANCINVLANDITLDLSGFTIKGDYIDNPGAYDFGVDAFLTYGIPVNNFTLINGSIEGFSVGVMGYYLSNSLLENLTIVNDGIYPNPGGVGLFLGPLGYTGSNILNNITLNNNSNIATEIDSDYNNFFNILVENTQGINSYGMAIAGNNNILTNINAINNNQGIDGSAGFDIIGSNNLVNNLNSTNNALGSCSSSPCFNYGIYLDGDNNTINNLTSFNNSVSAGVMIKGANIKINNLRSTYDIGLYGSVNIWSDNAPFPSGAGSILGNASGKNISIIGGYSLNSTRGLYFSASPGSGGGGIDTLINNTYIQDFNISNSSDVDIKFYSALGKGIFNTTFVNVSYLTRSYINSGSGGPMQLIVKWYLDTKVVNSLGSFVENALIRLLDLKNNLVINDLTNSTGDLNRYLLTEYTDNGNTLNYFSPINITTNKTNYQTDFKIYNLTSSKNIYDLITLLLNVNVNLISPLNGLAYSTPILFNCSADSQRSLSNATFFIYNQNGSLFNKTTNYFTGVINSTNLTVAFTYDEIFHWNCLVYDNESNYKISPNYTFITSTSSPAINLFSPINNSYLNYSNNIYFNYTASDYNGLSSCELWGNFNGSYSNNYTWINPTNNILNYTDLNMSDGSYLWNVNCTDTLNNGGFSLNNFSLTIDTIKPSILFNSITTTAGSQTVTVNSTENDTNLLSCSYVIFNSTNGIDSSNVFSCNNIFSATASSYGNFVMSITALDKSGNYLNLNRSYTLSPASPSSSGGKVNQVPVIALIKPITDLKKYSDTERAIIYLVLFNYCVNNSNFGKCSTSENNLISLVSHLDKDYSINMSTTTLKLWINQYDNNLVENIYLDKAISDQWKLIVSQVILTEGEFVINPSNVDTLKFVISGDLIEQTVQSSLTLSSCNVENGDVGFSCSVSNSSAKVFFKISKNDYFQTVSGKISYTSMDGKNAYQTVVFRIIQGMGLIIIGIIILLGLILFVTIRQVKKFKR